MEKEIAKKVAKKVEKKDAVKCERRKGGYFERQKIDIFRKEYGIDEPYEKIYRKDLEKLFAPLHEHKNTYVCFDISYRGCYYEGDTPSINLIFGSDVKRWETDKEYKKRCRQEPYDGMKITDKEQFVMDYKEMEI